MILLKYVANITLQLSLLRKRDDKNKRKESERYNEQKINLRESKILKSNLTDTIVRKDQIASSKLKPKRDLNKSKSGKNKAKVAKNGISNGQDSALEESSESSKSVINSIKISLPDKADQSEKSSSSSLDQIIIRDKSGLVRDPEETKERQDDKILASESSISIPDLVCLQSENSEEDQSSNLDPCKIVIRNEKILELIPEVREPTESLDKVQAENKLVSKPLKKPNKRRRITKTNVSQSREIIEIGPKETEETQART